ncbi:MAG: purine-nucleoside phosphorylase [bacterium]|jgi:purine-nucleoside phosphorylase
MSIEYFNKQDYLNQINETFSFLSNFIKDNNIRLPKVAVVLGSGLNEIPEDQNTFKKIAELDYKDIPNFGKTTVSGHKGKLIFSSYKDITVLFFQGRFHYYEGYNMKKVTFYVRVLKKLGVNYLIITNASGGVNPAFKVGDIMIISDHIALFLPENPLRGENLDEFGERFISMQNAYDKEWRLKVENELKNNDIPYVKGVYCMVSGPNYETPSELRMLKIIGVDAVGMSTVPEVIVANHSQIKVFGLSIVTDIMEEVVQKGVTHQEVLDNVKKSLNNVKKIITIAIDKII